MNVSSMRLPTLAAAACLLAASPVPAHVQTSDYFGGYAGTHLVAPQTASRWLTWAETNIADSIRLRPLGPKTLLYTDPNRTMSGEPDLPSDGSGFAYDCAGARIEASARSGQFQMDPHSPSVLAQWKSHVTRYASEGHFDAIFEDDADNLEYLRGAPCNYNPNDWLAATNRMQQLLHYPIVFNGLSEFTDGAVSATIALNATTIGGMMEECFASSPSAPKTSGLRWAVEETTQLRMVREGKLFFCYGNDTTAAENAIDGRLYVYASFLLSYDPELSVLWEYYQTPKKFHVMPETQLVALQPRRQVRTIDDLKTATGVFEREYRVCYLAGRNEGPCVIAVNPDETSTYPLDLKGYGRTLRLLGSGVLDGGTARADGPAPPPELAPASAVIAFRTRT